jgi:hypothetical protein
MTTDDRFSELVVAVTHALGPQTPLELRGEWPEDGGDNTPANTAEWRWQGHDVFVHAHDPLAHDEVAYDGLRLEVLVVITAVDPHSDFTDLAAALNEEIPTHFEVDISDDEPGSPVMVCATYNGYSDFTPEALAIDVEMLLTLAKRLAAKVAG